ncbi:hypothetical protein [Sphingomonas gilva]|uniref:hypothetical protein n=1 Tax=Sphingomonas gilva TaxID=2305907 RepID=UPI0015FAE282|nr:hypothetical protein [Sphingomonas gilva]
MRNLTMTALALALAACGGEPANQTLPANDALPASNTGAETDDAVADPADDTPAPTPEDSDTPAPAPSPAPTPAPAPAEPGEEPEDTATVTIPAQLRGRWGLTPADCTSTRGDAKGLLRINRDTLRFYESRGTLARVIERDRSRIVAEFAFTGEGQTWTRRVLLDGQDRGRTLVRREYGEDAMPGALRYRKCEA